MILKYIAKAIGRARFEKLEDGSICATVPGLKGVLALGDDRRECKVQLAEVIEEWVLVRVSQGLSVPKLDGVGVQVRRAS